MPTEPGAFLTADDVIITDRLDGRAAREPDHATESRALGALATELAERPANLLQKLTDTIVEEGIAASAGISIAEGPEDGRRFSWLALSGAWGSFRGGIMPFDASPCGIVMEREQMLLFESPERFFPAAVVEPLIHEILLVPFHVGGKPVGTVWINAHDPARKFDQEDARLLKSLARFASAGYQMGQALAAAHGAREAIEGRYKALFNSTEAGFGVIEVLFDGGERPIDYVYLDVNPAFAAQTGLDGAIGRRIRELRPELEAFWIETYGRIARTGRPERFERESKTIGRWFDVYAFRIDEPEKHRVAMLINDITLRKRMEGRLRESEARLRALVNATSYAVYRMSPDWSELRQLDGCGFLADTGKSSQVWWGEYILPEDQAGIRAAIERAIRGKEPFDLEHRIWQADGSVGWARSRAIPLLDENGDIREWFGAASDVTPRKRAEAALRESEERFRQFAEASSDLIWIRDAETLQTEYLNPAFEVMYGESREAILSGDSLRRWAGLVHPDDREEVLSGVERVRAGERIYAAFRIVRPSDGEIRWIENTDFPLLDEQGRVRRIAGFAKDVTDARRSAARLELLVDELQHRSRNLLGVIASVASKTLGDGGAVADFQARLAALSRAHGLLSRFGSDTAELGALVRAELEAHTRVAAPKVALAGPEVHLTVRQVQNFSLAFHELTTNAVKYGALRDGAGQLAVNWEVARDEKGKRSLLLDWVESGVEIRPEAMARRGYGRPLIEKALVYALDATTDFAIGEDGVRCRIRLPLL